jgi:hypothetical protein
MFLLRTTHTQAERRGALKVQRAKIDDANVSYAARRRRCGGGEHSLFADFLLLQIGSSRSCVSGATLKCGTGEQKFQAAPPARTRL